MKIVTLDEVDSTNEYCKRCDCGEDILVIAARQTSGKGTKGRSFASDSGGLYFTVMRHYVSFPAAEAFKIMINSCVAVCKTLEKFGITPTIRWANDVLVGGRKISGTLIENTFSGPNVVRSIVGTGINVNNTLPPELENIAVSARECLGKNLPLGDFKDEICANVFRNFDVSDYLRYVDWLGSSVKIVTALGEEYRAVAVGIEKDGRLIVERDGVKIKISAGEVSLRL